MGERAIHTFRNKLQTAGVSATVASLRTDDDEPSPPVVAVITRKPYDAWRALTGQDDPSMSEHPPVSIAERIDGMDVVIGTEGAFASFKT